MGGGVILDQGCYTTSMSLLVASLINNLDITNFKLKEIQTDYLDSEIDVHSYAKIDFDNKFISDITVSFFSPLSINLSRISESTLLI